MSDFRRFAAPTYFGAPTIPPGPANVAFDGTTYAFVNVVSAGVGGSGSAFADAVKADGPNAGSYFVAFGEDATSSNANRGLRALAENTDYIDDLLHRDVALPQRTNAVTAGLAVPSIALPAQTFVGTDVSYPIDMLFQFVDDADRELFNPTTGARITAASIAGAVIGDGFSTGTVTVTLTESIPPGQTYRIYYSSRGNLAQIPADALVFNLSRGSERVASDVEHLFAQIQGPLAQAILWNATPTSTLWDLASSGLDERYRRGTARDGAVPAYFPIARALDTDGSGGWYTRGLDGPGVTGFSVVTGSYVNGVGAQEHALGGLWAAVVNDDFSGGTVGTDRRRATSSGFVFLGKNYTTANDAAVGTPGVFGFYAGARRANSATVAGTRTLLRQGDVVAITGATINLPGTSHFSVVESGQPKSAFALGHDILRIRLNGQDVNFTLSALITTSEATLRHLDGSIPNYGATSGPILEWIRTSMFTSDGGVGYYEAQNAAIDSGVGFRGFFWAALPPEVGPAVVDATPAEYARFFARDYSNSERAFAWGGYKQTGSAFEYTENSYLYGDGSALFNGLLTGSASGVFTTTAVGTGQAAVKGTGNAAGRGGWFIGGAAGGPGLQAEGGVGGLAGSFLGGVGANGIEVTAGAGNGKIGVSSQCEPLSSLVEGQVGVKGLGAGIGSGVWGHGGDDTGTGGFFQGGDSGGTGLESHGTGTGLPGIYGVGGPGGVGVYGLGTGFAAGLWGLGGSGTGVNPVTGLTTGAGGLFGQGGANGSGVLGVGYGDGNGVEGLGGNNTKIDPVTGAFTGGYGLFGVGGMNGVGVVGVGGLAGNGVEGIGVVGVVGAGSATGNTTGVQGTGYASGVGVHGHGGTAAGTGIYATGGTTDGLAAHAVGGGSHGSGVLATGVGLGYGVRAQAVNGNAVEGTSTGNGAGVVATGSGAFSSRALTVGVGYQQFTAASPAKNVNVGVNNALYAKRVVKAWGRVRVVGGGGGTATYHLDAGDNVASVTVVPGNAESVRVTFALGMFSTAYTVIRSTNQDGNSYPSVMMHKDAAYFDVGFSTDLVTTVVSYQNMDVQPETYGFDFVVWGEQDVGGLVGG